MKRPTLSMLPLLAIAAACGGSGEAQDAAVTNVVSAVAATPSIPTDSAIAAKVYDNNYHVPNGFYVDERARTETRSYTIHHVMDQSASFERCTDDQVTAQAWEEADNASRAVSGYFVTVEENDWYFEFVRELDYDQSVGNVGDPTSPGYSRVFKCSFADRTGVDRSLTDGFAGNLNKIDADIDDLRDFSEYLWQFRFFDATRKVVLESVSPSPLRHTLLLAFVINQGSGRCDRIEVANWHFTKSQNSAEIQKSFETVRSFEAQIENGVAVLCP